MNEIPVVSVITPTYNRAGTIGRAIKSIQRQTYQYYEHIIVDDGSTDNTQDVISKFTDNRINYVRLSENQGANTARNYGINEANGDYISFLDSDDEYFPNRLERTVRALENTSNSVGGVFHAYEHVEDNEVVNVSTAPEERVQLRDLASENLIGGLSCTLFRTHALLEVNGFDEFLPASQDYDLYLRILRNYDLLGIPDVLSRYHGDESGIRDDFEAICEGQKIISEKHGDILSKKRISRHHYSRAFYLAGNAEIRSAREELRTAISIYPIDPLYYFHYLSSFAGVRGFKVANRLKIRLKLLLSEII